MGLNQHSSEGLAALELSDGVCTDGKATEDNACMQLALQGLHH